MSRNFKNSDDKSKDNKSEDLIFGLHAVRLLLTKNKQKPLCVLIDANRRDDRIKTIINLASAAGVKIERVTKQHLDELSQGAKHQSVIATCQPGPVNADSALKTRINNLSVPPFLLILDCIQDPHNLGACLRSAEVFGIHAVIAPKNNAVSITPVVKKVAAGATEAVPYFQVTNLVRTIRFLKQQGVWIIGTSDQPSKLIYEVDLKGPLALVMGNEGQGLRRLTSEHCDIVATIPQVGLIESLNVSVATGICLYEAYKQRHI